MDAKFGNTGPVDIMPSLDQAFQRYRGFMQETPITTWGNNTLRGGIGHYSPCVLDKTGWENIYQPFPVDYDIRNDRCFDLHRSTYNRLMDIGYPVPEPTTSEALRIGYCGPPENKCNPRPGHVRNLDKRPDPAYKLHLADRSALHFMRADPLEGALPCGRQGDMCKARTTTHTDYKWRGLCCDARPKHDTMERDAHRYAKTDIHGRSQMDRVVKFDSDFQEDYFNTRLMKLKKAYLWPINTITREPLGGSLSYFKHDPCRLNREDIWPCGEKNYIEDCPIRIPNDRCQILAHHPKEIPRIRERHFQNKSYLDMRYPIRNYECWEEVPKDCCQRPSDFPSDCCFTKVPGIAEQPSGRNDKKTCPC